MSNKEHHADPTDTLPEQTEPLELSSEQPTQRDKAYREKLYWSASREPFEQLSHYTKTFISAVERELGLDEQAERARIADLTENEHGPQCLLVYPDDTRLLVGRDETSTDSGLFAFAPGDPTDVDRIDSDTTHLRTVDQALNVLKPTPVITAELDESVAVHRQGEWWFVETDCEPSFTSSGELGARPYGPSPLENHVAREYGFGIGREELLTELSLHVSDGTCDAVFDDVPDCFDVLRNQEVIEGRKWSSRFFTVDWSELPDLCSGLFVRGTVRHRDNEHRMLSIGDSWHRAYTHDRTVYQPRPTTYSKRSILINASGGTMTD